MFNFSLNKHHFPKLHLTFHLTNITFKITFNFSLNKHHSPKLHLTFHLTNITLPILQPHSEKKFLLLKKQTSDLSPPTFNPSNYRNKSNKPSKHPTAFEGVCFFKSNKFFLSVFPKKPKVKAHTLDISPHK